MAELFGRFIQITVGNKRVSGLRMAFKINKSVQPEPNTTEISIWNLSEDSRAQLQNATVAVTIDAGYLDNHEVLFSGKLRRGTSTRQGPDWVTTLKAGDGELEYRTARVNESFSPGQLITTVAKTIAKKLGVGLGDAEAQISSAVQRAGLTQYAKGTVFSGKAEAKLTEVLKGLSLEWSIQDGVMQVIPKGSTTSEDPILLNGQTGLVGSPAEGTDATKRLAGIVKVTSLLQPGIRPGRKLRLDAATLKGSYRVERVTHVGDTHAQSWYSEAEVTRL